MAIKRVAVSTPIGVQNNNSDRLKYYYLVDQGYDFNGNVASDITNIDNLNLFHVLRKELLDIHSFRESLTEYYENDLASNWSGLSTEDKQVLAKYFIVEQSKREEVYSQNKLKSYAKDVYGKIDDLNNGNNINNTLLETFVTGGVAVIDNVVKQRQNMVYKQKTYYNEASPRQNATTSWKKVISLKTPTDLVEKDYFLTINYIWDYSHKEKNFISRVFIDGNTSFDLTIHEQPSPFSSSCRMPYSIKIPIALNAGVNNIELQFKTSQNNKTAYIYKAIMELEGE